MSIAEESSKTHFDTTSTLPIANSTESINETANSFREVWIEFDSSTIVRDRFLNLSRIFDSVCEIRESDVLNQNQILSTKIIED